MRQETAQAAPEHRNMPGRDSVRACSCYRYGRDTFSGGRRYVSGSGETPGPVDILQKGEIPPPIRKTEAFCREAMGGGPQEEVLLPHLPLS